MVAYFVCCVLAPHDLGLDLLIVIILLLDAEFLHIQLKALLLNQVNLVDESIRLLSDGGALVDAVSHFRRDRLAKVFQSEDLILHYTCLLQTFSLVDLYLLPDVVDGGLNYELTALYSSLVLFNHLLVILDLVDILVGFEDLIRELFLCEFYLFRELLGG